ncbi:hypothetical protein CEXT_277321 [Caerostris extrusa]|uniref:Maturase n=1 Tax=Caerostris extrusa TaxID=172846 RepID=A0AAV4VRS5_CAEEX|nr:hypothetical protein CEXT_277321 [Caerostris extrusa]
MDMQGLKVKISEIFKKTYLHELYVWAFSGLKLSFQFSPCSLRLNLDRIRRFMSILPSASHLHLTDAILNKLNEIEIEWGNIWVDANGRNRFLHLSAVSPPLGPVQRSRRNGASANPWQPS